MNRIPPMICIPHQIPDCPECMSTHKAQPQRPVEPVQKPVFEVGFGWLDDATKYPRGTKLYVAPPQRKPLTDEEIEEINRDLPLLHMQASKGSVAVVFARAIERAHGIGDL